MNSDLQAATAQAPETTDQPLDPATAKLRAQLAAGKIDEHDYAMGVLANLGFQKLPELAPQSVAAAPEAMSSAPEQPEVDYSNLLATLRARVENASNELDAQEAAINDLAGAPQVNIVTGFDK